MNNQQQIKSKYRMGLQSRKIASMLFCLTCILCSSIAANGQLTVKLYPSVIRIQKGKSKTITAVAYNGAGQPDYNATFTNFRPSNNSIATASLVSVSGDIISIPSASPPNLRTIAGNAAGVTNITATWNGVTSAVATIVVDDPSLSPTSIIHGDNDDFGSGSISTKVGEPIEVNAELSRGIDKIEWTWGDGDKTSGLLSTTHAYLVPGTYPVKLKITNSSGQTATSTVLVTVAPHSQPTQIIYVNTLSELLTAYNNAVGGEHIVIPAGMVLIGELELPAKHFTDYVTIRSSAVMPDIRNRIDPTNPGLVTLRGSTMNAIPLVIKNGASKIRLAGLKFDPKHVPADIYGPSSYYLAQIGEAFTQTDISQNPSKIILEHCVVNPPDDVNVVHAILNDGYKVSIISSWLGNIKTFGGQDSQAVVSYDGRGAHVYHNTFFEAASENVMYGGVIPSIEGITSTNIEFRRSHFSKRLSWRVYDGEYHKVNVKNLFETKNARRIYLEGSILENHWDAYRSQRFALVFKSATSPGMPGDFVPWAVSEDIVFENNRVSHTNGGITTSVDNYSLGSFHGLLPNNIAVSNTLFDDLSTQWSGPGLNTGGMFIQPNSVSDLQVDHTTIVNGGEDIYSSIIFVTNNNLRFSLKNSVFPRNLYGITGGGVGMAVKALNPGTGGTGEPTCQRAPNATWDFAGNVMPYLTTFVSCMPSGGTYANNYPASVTDIGFVDAANGNFQLLTSSPYKTTATDGSDPGVDMHLLNERTVCSVSGETATCLGAAPVPDVCLSGRITNLASRGISKTIVILTNPNGESRQSLTNAFGFYAFQNVPVGEYNISIAGRRYFSGVKHTWLSHESSNIVNFVLNN